MGELDEFPVSCLMTLHFADEDTLRSVLVLFGHGAFRLRLLGYYPHLPDTFAQLLPVFRSISQQIKMTGQNAENCAILYSSA